MSEAKERIAKTEALFRDVNERIAEASERFDAGEAEFMCECADPGCADRLHVPLEEYEEVREKPTTFVLNPDHVKPSVEEVVERRRGYAIVEKVDRIVAQVVRQLDPRTGRASAEPS